MARNLIGRKYKDMSERYRERNTQADYREDRRNQRNRMKEEALDSPVATNTQGQPRMAGDEVFKIAGGGSFDETRSRAQENDELIERLQRRQESGKNINERRLESSLNRQSRLQDRIAAQDEFDGTIDSYNFSSFGNKGAGLKDIEYLTKAGYNPNEINTELEKRGMNKNSRVDRLLSKYMNENMPEGIKEPETDKPVEVVSDEGVAFAPPSNTYTDTDTDIDVNIPTTVPGDGGGGGVSPTIATGVIGGDTGDVSLTDSSNYGTINTGIINDVRNYGGGYSAGSNNTGLAQAYVDLMEENLDKYSGDKYGMYVTDARAKKADDLRSINSNSIYGSMGQFAGNMYDRGLIGTSNLYGDPYKFPTAQYGGFQDFSPPEEPAKEKEKA